MKIYLSCKKLVTFIWASNIILEKQIDKENLITIFTYIQIPLCCVWLWEKFERKCKEK